MGVLWVAAGPIFLQAKSWVSDCADSQTDFNLYAHDDVYHMLGSGSLSEINYKQSTGVGPFYN